MRSTNGGALSRLVAGGVAAATAVAGVSLGLAAPAHAAPVNVTTTLTDPSGNALDGFVYAYALQPDGTYSSGASQYVADGVVDLPVEPGTYKFYFADADRLFVPEYYSDKATLDTADPVAVTGGTALAPVALAARPVVTGQVISPSGRPLKGQSVELYDAADNSYEGYASTKADGTFAFGVDPGTYKLYFRGGSGFAAEYFNNKPTLATADPVAVGAAGSYVGQVVLTKGAAVTGQLTNAAGAPLERARATIYTAGGSYVNDDLTDANGVFVLEGVRAGDYKVQFSDPVGEYLGEWFNDKADQASADVVSVGVEGVVSGINASLAADPDAAIDPAEVDVAGTVTDSAGKPVIGASVAAYDTPADADDPRTVDSTSTNRLGQYFLTGLDKGEVSESQFKIQVVDGLEREEGQYARLDRWFGGAQSYEAARVVGVPTSNVNVTLPLTGGISGTLTSESGLPVDGVSVRFFDEKGNPAAESYGAAEEDGTYNTTTLVPGTYKVQFVDYYYGAYGDLRAHAPEWYDNTVFSKAKTITVKSGQTVTGINAALSEQLRAMRKPEVRGKPYLGGKVRAYPGVWSVDTGTTYTYEWLVDGAVVGTGATYKIRKADKNERISLRVVADNMGLSGTAVVRSQQIQVKPKVKVAVKGSKATITIKAKKKKAKKVKGSVVVKKVVRTDDFGAPVYKKVGKGKIRNARATVTVKKQTLGKNKLVFFIKLKGKLGDAQVTRVVKVKR